MKIKRSIGFNLLVMLLILGINCACQLQQTPVITVTPDMPISTSTITPTQERITTATRPVPPTATVSPSPTPVVQEIQVITTELLSELPQDANLEGVIVMRPWRSSNLYLMDAGTSERIKYLPPYLNDEITLWGIDVSPNYQLLAYLVDSGAEHLYVVDASGKALVDKMVVDSEGNYLLEHSDSRDGDLAISLYWLDNEYLMIDVVDRARSGMTIMAKSAILFEPYTGKSQEYPPIYPGMTDTNYFGGWDMGYQTGMLFDPTLTRLIYVNKDNNGVGNAILWDLEQDEEILRLPDRSAHMRGPVWKADGSAFVIDLFIREGEDEALYDQDVVRDLYLFTRDGQATRLTYFIDLLSDAYTFSPRWSPDGRKIAFSFKSDEPSFCSEGDIFPAVIDLDTPDMVQVYCANIEYYSNPIWSPSGKQLLFISRIPGTNIVNSASILIDINKGYMALFSERDLPVGWMMSE